MAGRYPVHAAYGFLFLLANKCYSMVLKPLVLMRSLCCMDWTRSAFPWGKLCARPELFYNAPRPPWSENVFFSCQLPFTIKLEHFLYIWIIHSAEAKVCIFRGIQTLQRRCNRCSLHVGEERDPEEARTKTIRRPPKSMERSTSRTHFISKSESVERRRRNKNDTRGVAGSSGSSGSFISTFVLYVFMFFLHFF